MLPSKDTNFVEILRARKSERGNDIAFQFLNGAGTSPDLLNYDELEISARGIAAELQSRGLSNKQVLLLYPPGLDFIKAFLGCLFAGSVAVPVYPPLIKRDAEHIVNISKDAECCVLLSTSPFVMSVLKMLSGTFHDNIDSIVRRK